MECVLGKKSVFFRNFENAVKKKQKKKKKEEERQKKKEMTAGASKATKSSSVQTLSSDPPEVNRKGSPNDPNVDDPSKRKPDTENPKDPESPEAGAEFQADKRVSVPRMTAASVPPQPCGVSRLRLNMEAGQMKQLKNDWEMEFQLRLGQGVFVPDDVFYVCPILDGVKLSEQEMERAISQYLQENWRHDPGLGSCLVLKTCNKDEQQINAAVHLMRSYLDRILQHPEVDGYLKVRTDDPEFQEKVAALKGSLDFLESAGFKRSSTQENLLVFQKENFSKLESMRKYLLTSAPVRAHLSRDARRLTVQQAALTKFKIPEKFFCKEEQAKFRERYERAQPEWLNNSMRDEVYKIYRFTMVTVEFPDQSVLQGTFHAKEQVQDVRLFVEENLSCPRRDFKLQPEGTAWSSEMWTSTLAELKLVPNGRFKLTWCQ